MSKPTILAIETSCDETGVAITRQTNNQIEVLAEAVASQVDIHKLTGGVIPEVAAREHVSVIKPLLEQVIGDSGVAPHQLTAIAVTIGPGLQPALSVGVTTAQTLAYYWQKPIIPIHHLEGHIAAALFSAAEIPNPKSQIPNSGILPTTNYKPPTTAWPILALIVSGGHTMLVLMSDYLQYQILGSTRDDAVGEAFDKVARMLGLPYPGGPEISQLAESGHPAAFKFARPMINSPDFDFSFSGLKTEVLYTLRDIGIASPSAPSKLLAHKTAKLSKNKKIIENYSIDNSIKIKNYDGHSLVPPQRGKLKISRDIAASFQQAAVDTLITKTIKAAARYRPSTLLLTGGVAANHLLRRQLTGAAQKINTPLQISPPHLCGDNATMIALAAHLALSKKRTSHWQTLDSYARLNLEDFSV